MIRLVTFEQAREHLRLTPSVDGSPSLGDIDLQSKIDQATAIVLRHIERPTDAAWTAEIASWSLDGSPAGTPPDGIVAAVLLLVGELHRFRGDDPGTIVSSPERGRLGALSPMVEGLLASWRDPPLA